MCRLIDIQVKQKYENLTECLYSSLSCDQEKRCFVCGKSKASSQSPEFAERTAVALARWVWNPLELQLYRPLNAPWHDQMRTFTLTRQVRPQLQWCYTSGQLVKAQHQTLLAAGLHAKTATCNLPLQYSSSPALYTVIFPHNSLTHFIHARAKCFGCSWIYNKYS